MNAFPRLLAAALLALLSTGCALFSSEAAAQSHLADAMNAARDGDFDAARESLDWALEEEPGFMDAMMFRATLEERDGNLDEAVSWCVLALETDPYYVPAGVFMGLIQIQQRKFDEAEATFLRATEVAPGFVPAWTNLGILRLQTGNLQGAEEALSAALVLDERHLNARMGMYRTLQGRGEPGRALEHLVMAGRINAEDAQVARALAEEGIDPAGLEPLPPKEGEEE